MSEEADCYNVSIHAPAFIAWMLYLGVLAQQTQRLQYDKTSAQIQNS